MHVDDLKTSGSDNGGIMGTEIERKFLVNDTSWGSPLKSLSILQGYFPTSGFSLRVRVQEEKAFLTLKKTKSKISRHEFEYEIPARDAREIIGIFCSGHIVEKTRHIVEYKGFSWEIDVFHGDNDGLVVAEIELESEDETFEKPSWLGEEVSRDSKYLNAYLARFPYKTWNK
jgi:CYTH domain-containing protein